MAFAERTDVPVDRSKSEIESMLRRYGAGKFLTGWDSDRAVIGFEMKSRAIRMVLPLPNPADESFSRQGRRSAQERYEQETRRRWRALTLVIKAKLEAVSSGIVTFEEEWLAHFVLPGGVTVGEKLIPELESIYSAKNPPRLLLGYEGGGER